MTAARPLMLAVIESKIRFRSRAKIVSHATEATPNAAPATSEAKKTVGVPRPRRLTMPANPPI